MVELTVHPGSAISKFKEEGKNVYRLVDCINHCNIDNVTILFFRESGPLEGLVVVCSGPLSIYMGRWCLGGSLWLNCLGILLATLPLLRVDFRFSDGCGRTTQTAPYQAGGYRTSSSEKRR